MQKTVHTQQPCEFGCLWVGKGCKSRLICVAAKIPHKQNWRSLGPRQRFGILMRAKDIGCWIIGSEACASSCGEQTKTRRDEFVPHVSPRESNYQYSLTPHDSWCGHFLVRIHDFRVLQTRWNTGAFTLVSDAIEEVKDVFRGPVFCSELIITTWSWWIEVLMEHFEPWIQKGIGQLLWLSIWYLTSRMLHGIMLGLRYQEVWDHDAPVFPNLLGL